MTSTINPVKEGSVSLDAQGITPLDDAALTNVNGGIAITTAVLLATYGGILGAVRAFDRTRRR